VKSRTARGARERGAAAVEFALVLPLFLAVLLGTIEFANYLRIQVSVSQAAREAARSYAISTSVPTAQAAAVAGAPSLSLSPSSVTISPGTCDKVANPDQTNRAIVQYPFSTLTGFKLPPFINVTMPSSVNGTSAMRCGG
jgi:Flp pilus assembly protein TadG